MQEEHDFEPISSILDRVLRRMCAYGKEPRTMTLTPERKIRLLVAALVGEAQKENIDLRDILFAYFGFVDVDGNWKDEKEGLAKFVFEGLELNADAKGELVRMSGEVGARVHEILQKEIRVGR